MPESKFTKREVAHKLIRRAFFLREQGSITMHARTHTKSLGPFKGHQVHTFRFPETLHLKHERKV